MPGRTGRSCVSDYWLRGFAMAGTSSSVYRHPVSTCWHCICSTAPFIGLQDITGLLVVVVVAASLPACLANRGNIRIDMVGKLFGARVERALNAFGALCLLIFVALLAWQVLVYATEINSYGERTWVLRLPTAPAFFAAGLFLAVCVRPDGSA